MSKQTNYRVNRNELAKDYADFKRKNASVAFGSDDDFSMLVKEVAFWKEHAEKYAQVADESFNIW